MRLSRNVAWFVGAVVLAPPALADVIVVSPDGTVGAAVRRPGIRPEGGWFEGGAVDLTEGDRGWLLGAHLAMGAWPATWIDFGAGGRWWKADIDRDGSAGSVSNLSFHGDLRVPAFTWGWLRPYALAGISAQFVSADIPNDRSLEDAIAGFRFGFEPGVGIATTGGTRWRLEGRREFVEDVGNWTLALGVGVWPDVRAKRPERAAAPGASPAAPTWGAPVAPAPAAVSPLEPLVRELIQDNLALMAQVDSLRRLVALPAPPATTAPVATSEAAPAVDPPPAPATPLPGPSVALERAAALTPGARVIPAADGWRYILGDLSFPSGSSRLSAAARDELSRLVAALLRFPGVPIVVEGHTDSSGSSRRNLRLSQERADEVRAELVRQGVDPARITSLGLGSTRPLADNATAEARARNRRVEIRVLDGASARSSGRAP